MRSQTAFRRYGQRRPLPFEPSTLSIWTDPYIQARLLEARLLEEGAKPRLFRTWDRFFDRAERLRALRRALRRGEEAGLGSRIGPARPAGGRH